MEVQEQVDELKDYLTQLAYESSKTERMINRLSKEMKEYRETSERKSREADKRLEAFQKEMKEFKDEMKDFKNEMKDFKDEMKDFKNEMKDFKDEIGEYTNRADKQRKELNQQWGNLADKMGTIVEDLILPAVRPVLEKHFNCEIESIIARAKRKKKTLGLESEFDVIAASEDKVFLVETKSSPNAEYLNKFIAKQDIFRKLFPEYDEKKLLLIFSGIYFEPELMKLCTAKKVYAMAYREWDFMDILNFEEINVKQD